MKIMTILGTRPEIIRLSVIIKKLDQYCDHILVHTGQNFDKKLSSIFFNELRLREPDHYLAVKNTTIGGQIGKIIIESEKVILKEKPDRLLILGDTNSGLTAIVAKRMGIPVFHMEAGNRCFDNKVPEEVNRKIIDHASSIFLPYTYRSKENLIQEGIPNKDIFVIGNPIYEVMEHYTKEINHSTILDKLALKHKQFFLVTMHRAENVDNEERLKNLLTSLNVLKSKYGFPIICSLHPRTRSKMDHFMITPTNDNIHFSDPLGFFDFVFLEKNALCIVTDSGTVQEESCILKIPNITIRDVTERPETIESGSNMLTSVSSNLIENAVDIVLREKRKWEPPKEYLEKDVSSTVIKIILGYNTIL